MDEIASANGVSNEVNDVIYSHHHSTTVVASSLFDKNFTRIGHEETRRLLLRDDDQARPPNEETFQDRRTLKLSGGRLELAWRGLNHSPDNILIHLPDHDTTMPTPPSSTSNSGAPRSAGGSLAVLPRTCCAAISRFVCPLHSEAPDFPFLRSELLGRVRRMLGACVESETCEDDYCDDDSAGRA